MLGAVRLCEHHLDPGGAHQLVADHGAELGVCGGRRGGECRVLGAEPMARG